MNAETILKAIELALSASAFLRQIGNDPDALQAIVDKARAEGREIGAAEVSQAIGDMNAAGATLDALIAAKS